MQQVGICTAYLPKTTHISLAGQDEIRKGVLIQQVVAPQKPQRTPDPVRIARVLGLVRSALQAGYLAGGAPANQLLSPAVLRQYLIGPPHESERGDGTERGAAVPFHAGDQGYGPIVRPAAPDEISCRVGIDARPVVQHVGYSAGTKEEAHVVLAPDADALEAPIGSLQMAEGSNHPTAMESRQVVPKRHQATEGRVGHCDMAVIVSESLVRYCFWVSDIALASVAVLRPGATEEGPTLESDVVRP